MMAGSRNEEPAIKLNEAFDLAQSHGFYEIKCWHEDFEITSENHKVENVDNKLSKKLYELAAAFHRSEKKAFPRKRLLYFKNRFPSNELEDDTNIIFGSLEHDSSPEIQKAIDIVKCHLLLSGSRDVKDLIEIYTEPLEQPEDVMAEFSMQNGWRIIEKPFHSSQTLFMVYLPWVYGRDQLENLIYQGNFRLVQKSQNQKSVIFPMDGSFCHKMSERED